MTAIRPSNAGVLALLLEVRPVLLGDSQVVVG